MLIHNGAPVVGDIILIRNPSYKSRHVVKMRGVAPPDAMLEHYQRDALATSEFDQLPTDMVLLPSNRYVARSWADMMCGGDQDGDRAIAIFDPEITCYITDNPPHELTPSLPAHQKHGCECVTSAMPELEVLACCIDEP